MKIALIGSTGFVGKALLQELVNRQHQIVAIARNPTIASENPLITWEQIDINQVNDLAQVLQGVDAVISSFNAGWTNPNLYHDFLEGSMKIQEAVKKSGVKRFITIGGAGSLFIAPGLQLVDTPEFPQEYYAGATAARDYLTYLKNEKALDWAFISPAIEMHPGITSGRTGQYRLGLENPVFDSNQRSILSVEDLAVVIADEVEQAKHHQMRFTAAY
ncbi:NAD(P)-dependent oxidoreductase [Aquirufa beregesia]